MYEVTSQHSKDPASYISSELMIVLTYRLMFKYELDSNYQLLGTLRFVELPLCAGASSSAFGL